MNVLDAMAWFVITAGVGVVLLVLGLLVHDAYEWFRSRRPRPLRVHKPEPLPEYEAERLQVYRESGNDFAA